jgi:hypothetical protein
MGFGFGLLMSLILGSIHLSMVEKELKKGNYTVLNLHSQNKIIESYLSIEEIYELLKEKFDFKQISLNKNENLITAKIGMSMQSWGEKMSISKLPNSQSEYQIKSTPSLFSTVVDFGKNIKNINQVIEIIQDGK